MFSGVLTFLGRPGGFLFSADPVALTLWTHSKIVFRSGTLAFARKPKRPLRRSYIFAMFEESLHYKALMLTRPQHGDDGKLYDVPNLTELTTPLYLLWGPHSDFLKCGSYFCRTLY
jgi:hypothetical protein